MSKYFNYLVFVDIGGEHVFVGGTNTLHDVYRLIFDEINLYRKNYNLDVIHWIVFRDTEKILDFYM